MVDISECIEKQLTEIEILKSIYSNPNEFTVEDELSLIEANDFLTHKNSDELKHQIGFVIKFDIKNDEIDEKAKNNNHSLQLEIVCRLPLDYPLKSKPEILVRSNKNLNRKFYENLSKQIAEIHSTENDCCITTIIDWVKDNIYKFDDLSNVKQEEKTNDFDLVFTRLWIYFHHIFSTEKRQKIVNWARELDISGFSMPGKPGMICAEGSESNIQEYLRRVRSMPWQKVQVKDIETQKVKNFDELRKFKGFEEKFFASDAQNDHTDLGLLLAFLNEKGFSTVFQLFFGVDGKISKNENKNDT